jgi:hypothetical protein
LAGFQVATCGVATHLRNMRAVGWVVMIAACSTSQGDPLPSSVASAKPAAALAAAAVADAALDGAPSCVDGAVFDEATLRDRVAFLASPELDGRAPGTPADMTARAFISNQFRCLGLVPAGDRGGFEQAFADTANVVGYVRGTDDSQVIVVGAHHDHLGAGYLGANDNASGVVALLAIAQAVRQRADPPGRTIAFVAFGDEERGMVGSQYFVAHPPAALPIDRVVYDINLDMVGSYNANGAVYAMGTFPGKPARVVLDDLVKTHPKLHVGLGGRGERSDHEPFCQLDVPYVFFWTPGGRCYHERCDTATKVDVLHMTQIATLASELVTGLADSELDLRTGRSCERSRARARARN